MPRSYQLAPPPGTGGIGPALDKVRALLTIARDKLGPEFIDPVLRALDDLTAAYGTEARSNPRTARERRFWSRTATNGPHLIWTGMGRDRPDGLPVCDWTTPEGRIIRTTASRVVWLLETRQDIPYGKRLRKVCETPRCISRLCHEITDLVSSTGRRLSAYYYDGEGNPRCRLGHFIREPLPGKSVYCSTCYQIQREALRAAEAAQRNATARTRGTQRTFIKPQDTPEDIAMLEETGRFMDWAARAHPDVNLLDMTLEQDHTLRREYKQSLTPTGSDPGPSQPPPPTHDALWEEIQAMFDNPQG